MSARPMARRTDRTPRQVQAPCAQDRQWAVAELHDRVRQGRAGDEAVSLVLDLLDAAQFGGPVQDVHFRRWLTAAGFSDDGPEVA